MSPHDLSLFKGLEKEARIAEAKAKYIDRRLGKTMTGGPRQQWSDARDLYLAHAKTLRKMIQRIAAQTDSQ